MSFAISDFAGSYSKQDWKDIPGDLQWEAWNLRLIDATWHCADICGADVTGANAARDSHEHTRRERKQFIIIVMLRSGGFPPQTVFFCGES